MSVSIELLDAAKSSLGGASDYKLAQVIGVRQQTMSCWRRNVAALSAEKAITLCNIAGLDASFWLLKLYQERAKCNEERHIIDDLLTRLAA